MIDVNKLNKFHRFMSGEYGYNSSEFKLWEEIYSEVIDLAKENCDLRFANKNEIHLRQQKQRLHEIYKIKKDEKKWEQKTEK